LKLPLLSIDSRFVHFLEFLFELIVLNLLTLLCCIPVVTIGVAITALYRSLFDMHQGKGNIIKGYFVAFKDNFRPGLLLGLILILFCISFGLYLYLLQELIAAGDVLVIGGIILVAAILFFPMTFAFPLLATFDNSALRTLANGFLLSLRHLGTTLVVVIINGLPWLILVLSPSWFLKLFPLFLFLGFSLPGWISAKLFLSVFAKYAKL
jgi:uncharacterized membrane protein YesL